MQYDLFTPIHDPVEELRLEMTAIKESGNKVRKGTYARLNKLEKLLIEIHERQQIIERNICQRV
jgi:hypothetical protein